MKQNSAQAQQFPVSGKTHLVQVTSCQRRVIRTITQVGIIYIIVQSLLSCASQLLYMQKTENMFLSGKFYLKTEPQSAHPHSFCISMGKYSSLPLPM